MVYARAKGLAKLAPRLEQPRHADGGDRFAADLAPRPISAFSGRITDRHVSQNAV